MNSIELTMQSRRLNLKALVALVQGFFPVPERSIRWRSLSVENCGASALRGRVHNAMGKIESNSSLPLSHFGDNRSGKMSTKSMDVNLEID